MLAAAMSASAVAPSFAEARERPSLVVFINVDQLGSTYLTHWDRYLTGGIAKLKKRGAYFPQMRFEYANTETAPGHATIATGTWPNVHGMIANYWYDSAGKRINCVDDPTFTRSPANLRARSIADALALATDGKSRVVSVALKDRAAIILAGSSPRAAVWFDRSTGKFEHARWKKEMTEPKWVADINATRSPASAFGGRWDRLRADLDYTAIAGPDDDFNESDSAGLGRTMPKIYGAGLSEAAAPWFEAYNATPHALESLLMMAKRAVTEEQLGKRGTTDMLAVGISNLDYTGHFFGPRSHEAFDMFLRIDRAVGELIDHIDREVGAGSTLFVLTADHGIALLPEDATAMGVDAQRIDPRKMIEQVDAALAKVDPKKPPAAKVLDLNAPRLYLQYLLPVADRLPYQRAAAAALRAMPEIVDAQPSSEIGKIVEPFRGLFERSLAAGRDPDVMFLHRAYDLVDYVTTTGRGFGTGHGTPYLYDMSVPVIIAGPGVSRSEDRTPYPMTRLAPTVAQLAGIEPPPSAFDRPLLENDR